MSIFCHDIQMPVKANVGTTMGRDVVTKLVPADEILLDSDPFILLKHSAPFGLEAAGTHLTLL